MTIYRYFRIKMRPPPARRDNHSRERVPNDRRPAGGQKPRRLSLYTVLLAAPTYPHRRAVLPARNVLIFRAA
jgi:hypothetical protein